MIIIHTFTKDKLLLNASVESLNFPHHINFITTALPILSSIYFIYNSISTKTVSILLSSYDIMNDVLPSSFFVTGNTFSFILLHLNYIIIYKNFVNCQSWEEESEHDTVDNVSSLLAFGRIFPSKHILLIRCFNCPVLRYSHSYQLFT